MSELFRLVVSMSRDIRLLKACIRFFQKVLHDKQQQAWVDDREAARRFHVSTRRLQRMRQQGRLPFTRFCGKTYYKVEDLERMLSGGEN